MTLSRSCTSEASSRWRPRVRRVAAAGSRRGRPPAGRRGARRRAPPSPARARDERRAASRLAARRRAAPRHRRRARRGASAGRAAAARRGAAPAKLLPATLRARGRDRTLAISRRSRRRRTSAAPRHSSCAHTTAARRVVRVRRLRPGRHVADGRGPSSDGGRGLGQLSLRYIRIRRAQARDFYCRSGIAGFPGSGLFAPLGVAGRRAFRRITSGAPGPPRAASRRRRQRRVWPPRSAHARQFDLLATSTAEGVFRALYAQFFAIAEGVAGAAGSVGSPWTGGGCAAVSILPALARALATTGPNQIPFAVRSTPPRCRSPSATSSSRCFTCTSSGVLGQAGLSGCRAL